VSAKPLTAPVLLCYAEMCCAVLCPALPCRYYNWRQDTASDLLLVTGLSMVLLCTAAIIKHTWIDTLPAPQEALPPLSDTLGAAASDTAATAGASAAAAATAAGAAATAAGGSSGVVGQASSVGAVGAEGLRAYALSLWTDVYQVLVLSFGENFPNADGKKNWGAHRMMRSPHEP